MITEKGKNNQIIICDVCEFTDDFDSGEGQVKLFVAGWRANSRARKYVHLCPICSKKLSNTH